MSEVFTYFAYKNSIHFSSSHHLITYVNPTRICPQFYMVAAMVIQFYLFFLNMWTFSGKIITIAMPGPFGWYLFLTWQNLKSPCRDSGYCPLQHMICQPQNKIRYYCCLAIFKDKFCIAVLSFVPCGLKKP